MLYFSCRCTAHVEVQMRQRGSFTLGVEQALQAFLQQQGASGYVGYVQFMCDGHLILMHVILLNQYIYCDHLPFCVHVSS